MKRIVMIAILMTGLIGCSQETTTTSTIATTTQTVSSTTTTTSEVHSSVISEPTPTERIESVITAFRLPEQTEAPLVWIEVIAGVEIRYESLSPDLLSDDGSIKRGLFDEVAQVLVSFIYQDIVMERTFAITIKARTWTEIDVIEQDASLLTLEIELVDADLNLPRSGFYGSLIVWKSSHPYIISAQGKYYPPVDEQIVTLTATLMYEGLQQTKTFVVTAKAIPDATKIDMAAAMLFLPESTDGNLLLTVRGYYAVDIHWSSSRPDVISEEGHYVRPVGDVEVELVATLTLNEETRTKIFVVTAQGSDPIEMLEAAAAILSVQHGIPVLFESVELPTTLLTHVSVAWISSNPAILSEIGTFQMPESSEALTLTATLRVAGHTFVKEFSYMVYGIDDQTGDQPSQNFASVSWNATFPLRIEKGLDLTLGAYDSVMFKDGSIVLVGDALIGHYTSPIYMTQPFVRLNVMWGSITHPLATTSMFLRTRSGDTFSEWRKIGSWGYGGSNQPPAITVFVPQTATEYQYRITLERSSDAISSPRLDSVTVNPVYVSSGFTISLEELPNQVHYIVPQLRQADTQDVSLWNNICWATSISMVLQHYGRLLHLEVPQEYYAPLIRQGTEQYGTTKNDIGATQFEMVVSEIEFQSLEMLLYAVAQYGPIVVGVSKGSSPDGKFGPLTFSSGHVIVVVGYEISESGQVTIFVNDPAVSWIREVFSGPSDQFMQVWDKAGMLLQPLETTE